MNKNNENVGPLPPSNQPTSRRMWNVNICSSRRNNNLDVAMNYIKETHIRHNNDQDEEVTSEWKRMQRISKKFSFVLSVSVHSTRFDGEFFATFYLVYFFPTAHRRPPVCVCARCGWHIMLWSFVTREWQNINCLQAIQSNWNQTFFDHHFKVMCVRCLCDAV